MPELDLLLRNLWARIGPDCRPEDWAALSRRVTIHAPRLHALLYTLYGQRADFEAQYETILATAGAAWLARPLELKQLDTTRERNPRWFQSNAMLGGIAYVDLFAGNLDGIRARIPYFKEIGLTYLHLMPLFACPPDNSDGGYAVSTYREVNPALGTMTQLRALADALRHEGISLCVDFIFNHTSDEHEWAKNALAGVPEYRDYYLILPRGQADDYDRNLREIFPDQHPGAFTPLSRWLPGDDEWVWTTFNSFQWDLNYANPAVFNAMAAEMLFITNAGIDVLRMDAVAFIWKQLGTGCENLPEAHLLIQAFNALTRIAAPALAFKSEAIVHPDDVVKYIRPDECQISYNPLLMALVWNSLATREVNLLQQAVNTRFVIHPDCGWVNYVRCHDDIGWTFSDEDAAALGINGHDHRRFLNNFYTGRFDGSFALGVPFQENPKTGDCRISGMGASLAGLEQALTLRTEGGRPSQALVDMAISRILLIHGIILSFGGLPLIYLGDEIGTRNDYAYRADPHKAGDSRWVHRPRMDWAAAARRHVEGCVEARIFSELKHMIDLRKSQPCFSGSGDAKGIDTANPHVLGFARYHDTGPLIVFANFSEQPWTIPTATLRSQGLSYPALDLISGAPIALSGDVHLGPYQLLWLRPA